MAQNTHLWWWMFDLDNRQLITSRIIPGDISDSKQIVLTEAPIPGLNYQPVLPGGRGNRRIGFELPLIRRGVAGNIAMLQQFMALRNTATGGMSGLLTGAAAVFGGTKQFRRSPKVLYNWGIGSVPLVWWVAKCDATHKEGWVNEFGIPQYSEVQIELVLDEEHWLNRWEEMMRIIGGTFGNILGPAQSLVVAAERAIAGAGGNVYWKRTRPY